MWDIRKKRNMISENENKKKNKKQKKKKQTNKQTNKKTYEHDTAIKMARYTLTFKNQDIGPTGFRINWPSTHI